MKKKILIIGGSGFLGYHLAEFCLNNKRWKTTIVSKKKPQKIRYLPQAKYIKLDITNKLEIKKKITFDYDYVVNLAGYVNHHEKTKTYNSHYKGCKNLVDFFLKKKIKSFIQIGSCTEYGSTKSPQIEKLHLDVSKIESTYGKAKLMASNYLLKKYKNNNFPCTILRLYLVYGPKQDFNRLVPVVIKSCIKNKTFPCSSGNQIRDFLYVDDFVKVVIKCLISKFSKGQVFNIGSSNPIKVKHVINLIKNKIKSGNPQFGKIPLRKDEIKSLYPNINKSLKKLNWKPRIKFLTGIKKTIKYYQKSLKYN